MDSRVGKLACCPRNLCTESKVYNYNGKPLFISVLYPLRPGVPLPPLSFLQIGQSSCPMYQSEPFAVAGVVCSERLCESRGGCSGGAQSKRTCHMSATQGNHSDINLLASCELAGYP